MFRLLFLALDGLFSGLGYLTTGGVLEVDTLDDTDGNSLSHVTHGKTTKWGELLEGFNAQWFGWDQDDDGGITRFDGLWIFFGGLTRTTVNLLLDFGEFAGNVSGVAIQYWSVTVGDLSWMVEDDDLSCEVSSTAGWVGFGVTGNVATTQFLDGNVLDVETDIVSGHGLWQSFVVHFNGLDFSGDVGWGKDNNGTWFQDTGFNTTDWYCSNTADFVNVLEWETQSLVCWARWW